MTLNHKSHFGSQITSTLKRKVDRAGEFARRILPRQAPRAQALSPKEGKTIIRISAYSLLRSIAITMLVAGLPAAQALTPAGPKRPATVPADYVITPFGYFHPSCVMHLAKGDVVRQDENAIRHANGTSDNMPVCAYAHYKADGEKVTGDERAVTGDKLAVKHNFFNGSNVVEYAASVADIQTGSISDGPYGALFAKWKVPPAPSTDDGQTLHLYPGMSTYTDPVLSTLQPTLSWNDDFPSAWGIASWNCCPSGITLEAAPVPVNSGDTIVGQMFETCGAGCPTWDVVIGDETLGLSENNSELLYTSSLGQTFNYAYAGVLEAYGIAQCSDYPPNHSITFYDLSLYDWNLNYIYDLTWQSGVVSGQTPACNFGVGVNLHY
jgi:hypothetical protein